MKEKKTALNKSIPFELKTKHYGLKQGTQWLVHMG